MRARLADVFETPPALVDIITPTNRRGEFLQATVESVISQTHTSWRHYIIDNGSPDPRALAAAVDAAVSASPNPVRVRRSSERTTSARDAKPRV